jgi:hypothetical protein
MSKPHSTTPAPTGKPTKPGKPNESYPDCPLTAHPAGPGCKKIRGKLCCFGLWSDPDSASRSTWLAAQPRSLFCCKMGHVEGGKQCESD